MNWTPAPETESQPSHGLRVGPEPGRPAPQGGTLPIITIGKALVFFQDQGKDIEVFTMSLGSETIQLLPFSNWNQLDLHKWTVRGKLPASPAGLEINFDHLKVAGKTVSIQDPEGKAKLEEAFSEWLELEKQTLELARKQVHAKSSPTPAQARLQETTKLHFQVELDQEAQVHIRCTRGKEVEALIGLNPAGLKSLFTQGLMRKPQSFKVGALHNWIELDGVMFSFEKGHNDCARLEQTLNEKYLPSTGLGQGKDIVAFTNAASSTGFDLQFSVSVGGVPDVRKRHLNEETLELLQDPDRCGLLHKHIVIKLSRPSLIFKQKTPDGGERYLDKSAATLVIVTGDDGQEKVIDLSQPVNYMRLSAMELTAVFNHPAINQHSRATPRTDRPPTQAQPPPEPVRSLPEPEALGTAPPPPALSVLEDGLVEVQRLSAQLARLEATDQAAPAKPEKPATDSPPEPAPAPVNGQTATADRPAPNAWLEEILAQPPIRHDWFACLAYSRIAERLGHSRTGRLGLSDCWAVPLGDTEDPSDPAFKGIFLTTKGGLGYFNQGRMVRFNKGVAFIGTQEKALEGIPVSLVALAIDAEQRVVFIVNERFRSRFDAPEPAVLQELKRLREAGAVVMSVKEALAAAEALEMVWTVPAAQADPTDPQAQESIRPELSAK